jgi:hypothetical protein
MHNVNTDRVAVLLVSLCIVTLCFGEVHATLTGKPHSELFDATLGSFVGYFIAKSSRSKPPDKPSPPSPITT